MRGRSRGNWVWLLTVALLCPMAFADLADVDEAVRKSQQAYVDHFTEFTKDKNVQGKSKTPDGKVQQGGKKSRQNADDGGNFQSDTTYHDYSFDTKDQEQAKSDPKGKPRTLVSFVSDHGSLGDSSLLERKVFENHKKYSKQQEEEEEKKEDLEKGIKYKSIFKITTKEAQKDPNKKVETGGKGTGNQDENDKVERREIREEVKAEIEEVGNISYETIERAAKVKESQEDQSVLPNSTLLAEAAYRAQEAWWNSTLANLSQGQINRGVRTKGGVSARPQLSHDMPDCDSWAQKAIEEQQKSDPNNAARLQALQKELQELVQKCKQMAQTKYNKINPKFAEDGKGDKIEEAGIEKENSQNRDLRNQLEALSNVRVKSGDLKANWKYEEKDLKSEVAIDYQDGETIKAQWTMSEQVDSYNQQLEEAAEGAKEVNSKLPQNYQLDEQKILSYQIEGGNVMEITKRAAKKEYEDYMDAEEVAPAESYEELLQKNK